MERLRDRSRPGFGYHLKVHSFRTLTMILAWILIVTAFYQKPELLTGAQRLVQRGIEAVGDALPRPLGPRLEFVFPRDRRTCLAPNYDGGRRPPPGPIDRSDYLAVHCPSRSGLLGE